MDGHDGVVQHEAESDVDRDGDRDDGPLLHVDAGAPPDGDQCGDDVEAWADDAGPGPGFC